MSAPDFLIVSRHVASNPVARAIAAQRMRQAAADFATRLYLLAEGEECSGDLDAAARCMGVALAVLEARDDTDPVIRGGLSALAGMARLGCRWRTADAGAVDVAMLRSMATYQQATARETQAAWVRALAARWSVAWQVWPQVTPCQKP